MNKWMIWGVFHIFGSTPKCNDPRAGHTQRSVLRDIAEVDQQTQESTIDGNDFYDPRTHQRESWLTAFFLSFTQIHHNLHIISVFFFLNHFHIYTVYLYVFKNHLYLRHLYSPFNSPDYDPHIHGTRNIFSFRKSNITGLTSIWAWTISKGFLRVVRWVFAGRLSTSFLDGNSTPSWDISNQDP